MNDRIANLIREFKTGNRAITGQKISEAIELQKALYNDVSQIGNVFGKTQFSDMENAVKQAFADAGIKANPYTIAGKDTITALRTQAMTGFASVVSTSASEIANSFFSTVLTGGSKVGLIKQIENSLVGTGLSGKALRARASLFAQDSLMSHYSTVSQITAEELNIEKFRYYGNVMKSTRDFCRQRAGNVYTKKQIKSWESMKWAGKKPGDIFIVRGGYNCRHHFVPIVEKD